MGCQLAAGNVLIRRSASHPVCGGRGSRAHGTTRGKSVNVDITVPIYVTESPRLPRALQGAVAVAGGIRKQ